MRTEITRAALEQKAQADYAAHRGQIVKLRRVSGYNGHDDSEDRTLDPPVAMRVEVTSEEELQRWMDEDWLDPVWEVEPVNPDELQLQGLRSFWMYATSYHLDGRTDPGDMTEAEA